MKNKIIFDNGNEYILIGNSTETNNYFLGLVNREKFKFSDHPYWSSSDLIKANLELLYEPKNDLEGLELWWIWVVDPERIFSKDLTNQDIRFLNRHFHTDLVPSDAGNDLFSIDDL